MTLRSDDETRADRHRHTYFDPCFCQTDELEALRVELVDTRTKLAEAQKQLAKYGEPDIEYGEEWPIKGDITRGSQLHATHSRLVRRTPWAVLGD